MLCLPRLAAAEGAGPAMQLISLVGQARLERAPVKAGQAVVPTDRTLVLEPGAVAQLVLGSVAVSMAGPSRLRLVDPHLAVMAYDGPGALRVAGGPALVRVSGLEVSLRQGAAALIHRHCVIVSAGKVLATIPWSKASPYQLRAGQRQGLSQKCTRVLLSKRTEVMLNRQLDSFQAPAAWTPLVAEVKLEDIQQAEGSVQRERQAQRETAACGCTEGGGAGEGVGDGKGGNTTTPEIFTTPVLIKVRGVPKGVSK